MGRGNRSDTWPGADHQKSPPAPPVARADEHHIDILTADFVSNLRWLDVVVGSNLFGDMPRSRWAA